MNRWVRFLSAMVILVAAIGGGLLYLKYSRRAREDVLKQDLRTMREAIDKYTMDRQEAPQSLDDLVRAHYIRKIPIDPVCQQMDWNSHFGESVLSPEKKTTGLDDVSSGCRKVGSNGTAYNTW